MKLNIILLALFFSNLDVNAQDFDWATDLEGGRSWVMTLTINDDDDVYSAIGYIDAVDFDPGTDEAILVGGVEGGTAIQKLDHSGNLLWVKSFDLSGGDGIIGNGLKITTMSTDDSGNLYAVGSFRNSVDFDPGIGTEIVDTEFDEERIFILKLDQDGDFIWVKTIGEFGRSIAKDLVIDNNGDLGIIGDFYLTIDFDPGPDTYELTSYYGFTDTFILKLTENGDFIWAKSIQSEGNNAGNSIIADEAGHFYVGGRFFSETDFDPGVGTFLGETSDFPNGYLLKLNGLGEFSSVRTIAGDLYSEVSSIDIDTEGNVYATGLFSGEEVNFDPGTEEELLTSNGEEDIFVLKISETMDFLWVKQLGGEGNDRDPLLEISAINSIYIGGVHTDDIDIDPSTDEFILTCDTLTAGDQDFFFAHLSQDGVFTNGIGYTGANYDYISALERGNDGTIYLGGAVSSTVDLDHSPESYIVIGEPWLLTGFLVKLEDAFSSLPKESTSLAINLFPNPSNNNFEIQLDANYEKVEVEVINLFGKTVLMETFTSVSSIPVKLDVLPGIYFVKVSIARNEALLKMIIY